MVKKIFKYSLPVQEKYVLELPIGAKILRVDDVEGLFYLWAIVDVVADDENIVIKYENRYLEFYKTGQTITSQFEDLVFLGTCKLFIMQELCLYVFENINPYKI